MSGPTQESRGCLLERTWRGTEPLDAPDRRDAPLPRGRRRGDRCAAGASATASAGSASATAAGSSQLSAAVDDGVGRSLRNHAGRECTRLLRARLHQQLLADPDPVAHELVPLRAPGPASRCTVVAIGRQRLAAPHRVVPRAPPLVHPGPGARDRARDAPRAAASRRRAAVAYFFPICAAQRVGVVGGAGRDSRATSRRLARRGDLERVGDEEEGARRRRRRPSVSIGHSRSSNVGGASGGLSGSRGCRPR